MDEGLPFSKQNRPWMMDDCIASLNQQWEDSMSKIPPPCRDALKEWAAVQVEVRAFHDDPQLMERCHRWGEQWVQKQMKEFPSVTMLAARLLTEHDEVAPLRVEGDADASRHQGETLSG